MLYFGKDWTISRNLSSVKALSVLVRTLPWEPTARAKRAIASSLSASTWATRSWSPKGEIKILHLGAALAGQRSGGFGPMGRILDLRDPLLGVVEQHDVFGHVSSP